MAIHEIQKVANMADPAKAFMYEVILSETKGGVLNAENFELLTTSYTFPGEKFSKTEIDVAGYHRTDAGLKQRNGTWKTETLVQWDADTIQEFENWMDIAHDIKTGIIRPSNDYKTSARVSQLDGNKKPVKTRKLYRLWPDETSSIEYNPVKPDAVKLTVNWVFDYWE